MKTTHIAKIMKRSWRNIDRRWWAREKTINVKKSNGRPFATTPEEESEIALFSTKNPFASTEEMKIKLNLCCSPITINNILKSIGLIRSTAAQKSALTDRHKLIRFNFCNSYKN